MAYIKKYNKFNFKIGDIVLIHYWWDGMITPVEIVENIGRKYIVTHNNEYSNIQNAPDETIKKEDIIDVKRK